VVLQKSRDVADGEGADKEDVLRLIQGDDDANLLILVGPGVDFDLKGRLLQGDDGDLVDAPAEHHSFLVLPTTPAVLHFEPRLHDAHLGAKHGVLQSCEGLAVPQKDVKLIQEDDIGELPCQVLLIEDSDL
jgi:hypothetical protein